MYFTVPPEMALVCSISYIPDFLHLLCFLPCCLSFCLFCSLGAVCNALKAHRFVSQSSLHLHPRGLGGVCFRTFRRIQDWTVVAGAICHLDILCRWTFHLASSINNMLPSMAEIMICIWSR